MRTWLSIMAMCGAALAQAPARPGPRPPARTSRLSGQVVADSNGLGLRRARVVMHPLEAGRPTVGVLADEEGKFEIRDIAPGAYSLVAERDGYLPNSVFRRGGLRMPQQFALAGGENITNLVFRMKPWSVLGGRVRFEDGEPAVGVRVALYREYFARARHGFRETAAAATNDRGEYRVHGLAAGTYFVAAIPEAALTGPGIDDQPRLDSSGREIPVPVYTTTYYPNTIRLAEALPVRVATGEEINGIEIYLRPVERRKLAGRIADGKSGAALSAASIVLERLDAGDAGSLPAPAKVRFDNNDRFTINDVVPGNYRMWVTGEVDSETVAGEANVLVTNSDIDNLEILVQPARRWQGVFKMYDGSAVPRREIPPRVTLEPRSERGAIVQATGWQAMDAALMPHETYDVFVDNLPENYFLAEVRVAGAGLLAAGLPGRLAGSQPFEMVLDPRGGEIQGRAFGPEGDVWSGARVALIPDPPRGRLQGYRETYADSYGVFRIFGIPPGRYVLTAWRDDPPCEIYNEAELEQCRASGARLDVAPGSRASVALNVKAVPGR